MTEIQDGPAPVNDLLEALIAGAGTRPESVFEVYALEVLAELPDDAYAAARERLAGAGVDLGRLDEAMMAHGAAGPALSDGFGEGVEAEAKANKQARRGGVERRSQSEKLIDIADAECDRFNDGDAAFVTVKVNGHAETWPVRSSGFTRWLRRRYFEEHGGAPNGEAIQAARNTVDAMAMFAGAAEPTFKRVASHEGNLYVDLCDETWRVVEVTPGAWSIINKPPVRFIRTPNMLPMPAPVKGSSVNDLRPFLNLSDEGFTLAVAWALAALRDEGPYPVLVLTGEQGSAKSEATRMLATLADPHKTQLRTPPRVEQDIFIAAKNAHVLAYDNLSGVQAWLSDAFCRVSTGASFATRELYTDAEEVSITVMRPQILNGIDEVVVRGDLADRAIFLSLEHLPQERRQAKRELRAAFEAKRPRIFGALLDALAAGLAREPEMTFETLPRMADFAAWAVACEPGYAEAGAFMAAYAGNREAADDAVVEASPVAMAIRALLDRDGGSWAGTATALYGELCELAGERVTKARGWPDGAAALGRRMARVQSALRPGGIEIARTHTRAGNEIRISTAAPKEANLPSQPSQPSREPPIGEGGEGSEGKSAYSGAARGERGRRRGRERRGDGDRLREPGNDPPSCGMGRDGSRRRQRRGDAVVGQAQG